MGYILYSKNINASQICPRKRNQLFKQRKWESRFSGKHGLWPAKRLSKSHFLLKFENDLNTALIIHSIGGVLLGLFSVIIVFFKAFYSCLQLKYPNQNRPFSVFVFTLATVRDICPFTKHCHMHIILNLNFEVLVIHDLCNIMISIRVEYWLLHAII